MTGSRFDPLARVSRSLRLAAVVLVSFAVLAEEVAVTRLFAVVLQHHFVFLAISVAICGLGLGGLLRQLFSKRDWDVLPLGAGGFAIASSIVLVLLIRWMFPFHMDRYWIAGALMVIPFAAAGLFFAELFARHSAEAGKLYAADLLGAGAAAVAVVGLLQLLGATGTILVAAAIGGGGGALAARRGIGRAFALTGCVLALVLFAASRTTTWLDIGAVRVDRKVVDRNLANPLFLDLANPPGQRPVILRTEWNAFARTDVVEHPGFGPFKKDVYHVYTNGSVPTNMIRSEIDLRTGDAAAVAARLAATKVLAPVCDFAFALGQNRRVLSIGPGGGMDVLLALLHGAEEVEGAELNPSILRIMKRYSDFNGHLYERPGVRIVKAEGRSYVRQSKKKYDLVYAALTQSAAGSSATALMESYLFTIEGFRDYWEHLTPEGSIAVVTHDPLLAARLFATAVTMLGEESISEPEATRHIALFDGETPPYRFLLILKKRPIDPGESTALDAKARERGFDPIFLPGRATGSFAEIETGRKSVLDLAEMLAPEIGTDSDLRPATDDRPFFYDLHRGIPRALTGLIAGAILLAILFSAGFLFGRRDGLATRRCIAPFALYFVALGVGFMLVEIGLVQKLILFLGYPTLALTTTLFALLSGAGAGSAASQRVPTKTALDWAWMASIGAGISIALLAAFFGSRVSNHLLDWPLAVRLVIVFAALAVLGFFLGVPFPSAIRRLGEISETDVPWMWGLNGVFSVVGSLAAAALGKLTGFRSVLLLGAVIYFVIGLALRRRAAARSRADLRAAV